MVVPKARKVKRKAKQIPVQHIIGAKIKSEIVPKSY
jgi:hypothetical protein